MTIKAEVIADSYFEDDGDVFRLTTMALTYPRFVHPEKMTHRKEARNASSSRAVPVPRALRNILDDMAEPVEWGSNKPGMQAGAELTGWRRAAARLVWRGAGYMACGASYALHKLGAHKQIANRVTEPWSHITVLVSATDWANFFALRDHPDADPTMRALAVAMREARDASQPTLMLPGAWHTPYVNGDEYETLGEGLAVRVSAARCARVSYLTHDRRKPELAEDLALYERLANHSPVHASPLEHQATPDTRREMFLCPAAADGTVDHGDAELTVRWSHGYQHGPFTGWRQFRKMLPNEAVSDDRSKL